MWHMLFKEHASCTKVNLCREAFTIAWKLTHLPAMCSKYQKCAPPQLHLRLAPRLHHARCLVHRWTPIEVGRRRRGQELVMQREREERGAVEGQGTLRPKVEPRLQMEIVPHHRDDDTISRPHYYEGPWHPSGAIAPFSPSFFPCLFVYCCFFSSHEDIAG